VKKYLIHFFIFILIFPLFLHFPVNTVEGASSPYQVPSSIENGWNNTYGTSTNTMTSGRKVVYDVYQNKFTSGGYQIVTRNFGQGSKQYLNFQGWAAILGHRHHTSSNHSTYIAAQNRSSGDVEIYSTLSRGNHSATTEISNAALSRCSNSERNRANTTSGATSCNMDYENMVFDAFLPLDDLFPDPGQRSDWNLFIIKEVSGHVVYSELIVPFDFDNLTHMGGEINLSSGVDANILYLTGSNTLRRHSPRGSNFTGYFEPYRNYVRVSVDEVGTTLWHGVRSPHDNNATRWTTSAYWHYGGDQAILSFTPDNSSPTHTEHSISDERYKNGNDYWIQPEDEVNIRLRGRDTGSLLQRTNLRLVGSGASGSARHFYDSNSTTHLDYYTPSIYFDVLSANRTHISTPAGYNRETTFRVKPGGNTHGHNYNVRAYHADFASNNTGWVNTGMQLRVDGVAPTHESQLIEGAKYVDGDNYWIQPNDDLKITLRQRDPDAGNRSQFIRFATNNTLARYGHHFYNSSNHSYLIGGDESEFNFKSARRTENTSYGTVEWNIGFNKHGGIYPVHYYYRDNVSNNTMYQNTGMTVKLDGEAPHPSFTPGKEDRGIKEIEVTIDVEDYYSGVNRFRYRINNEGSWDSWSGWIDETTTNLLIDQPGKNIIEVEAEDNVGNSRIVSSVDVSEGEPGGGEYHINHPPEAGFTILNEPYYVGEMISIRNGSYDKDEEPLTHEFELYYLDGNGYAHLEETQILEDVDYPYDFDLTFDHIIPDGRDMGSYRINLTVDDGAETDSTFDSFSVNDLTLLGRVYHTNNWESYHQRQGHSSNQFYSGEPFLLEAFVENYPIKTLTVSMTGEDINGDSVEITTDLTPNTATSWLGEIYETFMSEPQTQLREGPVDFKFEVVYDNPGEITRTSERYIEIIGLIHKSLDFHRAF